MNLSYAVVAISVASSMLALNVLSAQEPTPVPPPKFPLSLRAAENASWTVDVENKMDAAAGSDANASDQPAPSPQIKQLKVTKTGPIYHEIGLLENGRTWERWVFLLNGRNLRLMKQGDAQSWQRVPESVFADYERYESADFEGGEWINEKSYKGVTTPDKQPVHSFEIESRVPLTRQDIANYYEGSESDGRSYTASALVDIQTLLPLKIDNGREVRTYTFGPAPTSRLTPPGDVLAELKKWVSELDSLNRVN